HTYLGRYRLRHLGLMGVLSGFQSRGRAGLDQVAVLLGFPGKLGMSGDAVWDRWLAGDIEHIRHYCETDVLNTWLVYLRFEYMRGPLDADRRARELESLRSAPALSGKP